MFGSNNQNILPDHGSHTEIILDRTLWNYPWFYNR